MLRSAVIIVLLVQFGDSGFGSSRTESSRENQPSHPYKFTTDWFTHNIALWTKVLAPYKGRPEVHYLEVGVFEGRSVLWMLENILTHPSSTLTGVDLFPEDLKDRYLANLRMSGHQKKAATIQGLSRIALRQLQPDSYNIIYIDGGHTADEVLTEVVLCWELLKKEGLLIFDDYRWTRDYPEELRPRVAIDAFITAYRNYLEVVHLDYQAILRKKEDPPPWETYRTILDEYVYVWEKRELRRRSNEQVIRLSETERRLLETLLRSRRFGETAFILDPEKILMTDLQALEDRLGMEFKVRWVGEPVQRTTATSDHDTPLWITTLSSLATLLLGIGGTLLVGKWERGRRSS